MFFDKKNSQVIVCDLGLYLINQQKIKLKQVIK